MPKCTTSLISVFSSRASLPNTTDRQLQRRTHLSQTESESKEGEKGPENELQTVANQQERMAGVAARAAILCSYEEEARHLERQSRVLSAQLPVLDSTRFQGTRSPPCGGMIRMNASPVLQNCPL